jgi:D-alanine-D-alanine ligase
MTVSNNPIHVLVIFGGESSEHDVSIASARNVYDALDTKKYHIHLAYITSNGEWRLVSSVTDLTGVRMSPVMGEKKFLISGGDELHVDVLLPVLHGRNGEDGTVQGMAKLLHVPCAGPGLIGAAMTMDKDITKRLLRDGGVPVVDWVLWRTNDSVPNYEEILNELSAREVFVKPANAGSSVGVSKARNVDEFTNALKLAAQHDTLVLIEPAMNIREIELAVLGTDNAKVSTPGEVIAGADFYSYDDKYAADSKSTTQIPARLSNSLMRQLQVYALKAYRLTRGQGMARVDFFVTDEGQIYLNEINAIPGFTNISMYPKLWQHEGVTYLELLDYLIEDALAQDTVIKAV